MHARFVCYFPKAKISGLSPDYWPRMTNLCGLFLCVIARGGNRAGRAGPGRANSGWAKTGPGQNWLDFLGPKF